MASLECYWSIVAIGLKPESLDETAAKDTKTKIVKIMFMFFNSSKSVRFPLKGEFNALFLLRYYRIKVVVCLLSNAHDYAYTHLFL